MAGGGAEPSNLFIGARTLVDYNPTAPDIARITMGADCQIGPDVPLHACPPRGAGAA